MESQPAERPKKRTWRRVVRFITWTVTGIVLVVIFLAGSVYFFRDEIKSSVITEMNRHLRAEVRIDPANIDITLFSTFPNCALEFRDVVMLEALKKRHRDTLLSARQVRLHFSVLDIWRGRYEIKKISVADAVALPSANTNGEPNYIFWKQNETASQDDTRFLLNDVVIERVRFVYSDTKNNSLVSGNIGTLHMKGDFGASNYSVVAQTDLLLSVVEHISVRYVSDKRVRLALEVAAANNKFKVSRATAYINDLQFGMSGDFEITDGAIGELEMAFRAPDLHIGSGLSLLPEKYHGLISEYESSGHFYFDGVVQRRQKKWRSSGRFGARQVMINYRPENARAEEVNFSGAYEVGAEQKVEIRDLHAKLAGGAIVADLRLNDFNDPRIVCDLSAAGDFEKLHKFFPVDTLEYIRGMYDLKLGIAGRVDALKTASLSDETNFRLQCGVTELEARFRHDEKGFSITKCDLRAEKGEVTVKDLQFRRGSSLLNINGRLPGFLAYLKDGRNHPLIIKGALSSPVLDIDDFLPGNSSKTSSDDDAAILPGNFSLEMRTSISRLAFGKFSAAGVEGLVEIRDRKLMVSDLKLATMQGSATINAFADNSRGKLQVTADSHLEGINITQLFAQMNNFVQSTLSEQHIRGFADADIVFSGTWGNDLVCDPKSITVEADLAIDRGELIGFRPLECLGKFVEVKELENVRFSQLRGRVEIASGKITIPRTSVRNSAIDIEYWGSHTFDHSIDYHFSLLMSDLFAARHKSMTNTEFGEVARDSENKRSVFVRMTGNLDDPKISYDRQGLKQKIRSDIASEKKNMKSLLKEEFGLFRKSEDVKAPVAEKTVFRLETQAAQPQPRKELVLKKKDEEDF